MLLWLDDQLDDPSTPNRHTPEGWLGAQSSIEAIALVQIHGLPKFMDLDHDLGGEDTAMVFLKWLTTTFPDGPVPGWIIHSQNGVGVRNINSYLDSWSRSLEL